MSQITTHILDLGAGSPAQGVAVTLQHKQGTDWSPLGEGRTNDDGRIADLLESGKTLDEGVYRLVFQLEDYFEKLKRPSFYPEAAIVFKVAPGGQHYHVPLLLNNFGYSTYRGS